jgi:hypothetical protein
MTMLIMMPGFGTVGSPILELVAAAIAVDVGLLTDSQAPQMTLPKQYFHLWQWQWHCLP